MAFPRSSILKHRGPGTCRTLRAVELLERRELLSANVLSFHNDQASSGANLSETVLTPANVNSSQFGKLATSPVDGQVYAQPLYLENVAISSGPNAGTHNVVFVATEHDSVYAIDAASGSTLWQTSFISASQGISTVPSADLGTGNVSPELGITATPVIDQALGAIFAIATTKEVRADGNHYVWKLHALDLATGADKFAPLLIGDTLYDGTNFTYISGPSVAGSGDGSVNGHVTFNAARELERAALTLVGNNVCMAFGSYSDIPPSHGWIVGATADPQKGLSLSAAVNLAPNGSYADIWTAGAAIAYDGNGGFFVSTGNGTFDTTLDAGGFPVNADYGDSFVKLVVDPGGASAPNANGFGLKVADYFTPANQQSLDDQDLDLGSGGTVLLPDSAGSAAAPHLLVAGSKAGTLYLVNRDAMQGFNPAADKVIGEIPNFTGSSPGRAVFLDTPAFYNNMLYVAGSFDHLKAVPVTNAALGGIQSESTDTIGTRGATPSISANGQTNGIVWVIDVSTNELRAYQAANLANELYTSDQAAGGRDQLGTAVKFSTPTVADGEVFVGTSNSLVIYGLTTANNQTPNQRYLSAVFSDALGRAVDAGALAYWASQLDAGVPRYQVAYQIVHSDEYLQSRVIAPAYQRLLGRAASTEDLAFWVDQIQHHALTDEQLEAGLVGSPEFYGRAGGSNKQWVDAVYQTLLGRPVDSAGEAYWQQQLAQGTSRLMVAYGFATSAEREQQRISDDYAHYLGRGPDASGINYWLNQFLHGVTNETLVTGFVASDEYYRKNV